MVKKIGIGLLCLLIVLTSFINLIPKTYAIDETYAPEMTNELNYYSQYSLREIFDNQRKFDLSYYVRDLKLEPIEQTDIFYMDMYLDYDLYIYNCYYVLENKTLQLFYEDIYLDVKLEVIYNWSAGEITESEIFDIRFELTNLINESILISENYYIENNSPWGVYNNSIVNIDLNVKLDNNYNVPNEETQVNFIITPILKTQFEEKELINGLINFQPVINATETKLDIYINNFNNDITYSMPHFQYYVMESYKNSFTDPEDTFGDTYYNIMNNVFSAFTSILNTQVFPNITIGLIIGLPLLLGLFLIILKLIRG